MAESVGQDMHEYLVWWASGGMTGIRPVTAPDAETARHDLEARPWRYGLPHERATVLKVMRRVVIDPERSHA